MKRESPLVAAAVLLQLAAFATAQERFEDSDASIEFGPGTQGFVVYESPFTQLTSQGFIWTCGPDGSGGFVPAGAVGEDVHSLSEGMLASFTFAYRVLGSTTLSSGTATAIVTFYANNPSDATAPTSVLASYTIPGLPWVNNTYHVHTEDVFDAPFVPRDMWVSVEIDSEPGTAGGFAGKRAPGHSPVHGTSHNVSWFFPSSCVAPPGTFVDNSSPPFGISPFVANYPLVIRVFFDDSACQFPVPNGSFETSTFGPQWQTIGRTAVLGVDFPSPAASGGFQAGMTNGSKLHPSSTGVAVAAGALQTFLGVPSGTLDALASTACPGGCPATFGSAIKQTVSVQAGDTLEFKWKLLTDEIDHDFFDLAFVTLASGGSVLHAERLNAGLSGSPTVFFEETATGVFTHTFTSADSVTLGFGVVHLFGDTFADSALLVDCVELIPGAGSNEPPECSVDLELARASFLETAPGSFVVTVGETFLVPFTGNDADGDPLMVTVTGLPAGASVSPTSGAQPLESLLQWTPSASDKAGAPYTIALTFHDGAGPGSTCSVTVADVNLRPVCSASDQTVECTSPQGATVVLDGSATDADDAALGFSWVVSDGNVVLDDPSRPDASGVFPIGVTTATLTVVDGRGGVSCCSVQITVEDSMPPEVMCTSSPTVLWPPNHTMRAVEVVVAATDACSDPGSIQPLVVHLRSSEPDDAAEGDGSTTGDTGGFDGFSFPVDITPALSWHAPTQSWRGTVLLRAERQGDGSGRQYTIDVMASDSSGNVTTASCGVIVPHDKRRL